MRLVLSHAAKDEEKDEDEIARQLETEKNSHLQILSSMMGNKRMSAVKKRQGVAFR